jgi:O-methyltransferase
MTDAAAPALAAPALADCAFYHTVDLPDGVVRGQWDLRDTVDAYLGHVGFSGKSVLEIGPASGFLTFEMEKRGAQVTALEPPLDDHWDVVPLVTPMRDFWLRQRMPHIRQIRNSFLYLHRLYGSSARSVECRAEDLPPELGDFDIGLIGSVLLHTRSPFSVIEHTARRVRETMIITDAHDATLPDLPMCRLLPRGDTANFDTWWSFTPAFILQTLGVLGFGKAEVTFSHHRRESHGIGSDDLMVPMFTVVAHRTV